MKYNYHPQISWTSTKQAKTFEAMKQPLERCKSRGRAPTWNQRYLGVQQLKAKQ